MSNCTIYDDKEKKSGNLEAKAVACIYSLIISQCCAMVRSHVLRKEQKAESAGTGSFSQQKTVFLAFNGNPLNALR